MCLYVGQVSIDYAASLMALVVLGLALVRFVSIKLISTHNGEGMRMKQFAFNMRMFSSALLETIWAMSVSIAAGLVLPLSVNNPRRMRVF